MKTKNAEREPDETSEPISLEEINEFLIAQKGRCIRCGSKFAHCGGRKSHEVAIPCKCCFNRSDGLICMQCAAG
jgi:hypothetical protein